MKNQAKLKIKGMGMLQGEEIYYYLKFGGIAHGKVGGGIAAICLLPHRELWCRGISFCNPKDQFIREKGRDIALGRALKAMESRSCSNPIPRTTPAIVLIQPGIHYLSTFNTNLTDYEERVVALVVKIREKAKKKAASI